jgi:23S rRNA pseudouridine1911/1915/1917 synthase
MKITVKQDISLLEFLMQWTGTTSKSKAKEWVATGQIRCNGNIPAHVNIPLFAGDVIEKGNPKDFVRNQEKCPFTILFEDKYLIAIDKPAGVLTMGDVSEKVTTAYKQMNDFLKETAFGNKRAEIVHRLDKEVSGVLLFAKTEQVQEYLRDNWQENRKFYYALAEGRPKKTQGTYETWLMEGPKQKMMSVSQRPEAKLAITHYKVLDKFENNTTLLEIELETGRKNQIRVHLAEMGCPIVGDWKYGADETFTRRIRLHAHKLILVHPVTGKTIEIDSPMPKHFLVLKPENENYK